MSKEKRYKIINGFRHLMYDVQQQDEVLVESKSKTFFDHMNQRRSIRQFSTKPVSKNTISYIIQTASTAPSGAHKQPWTFCAISNKELKSAIRKAAEEEERKNYSSRMSERWKEDLGPLGTDFNKDFLEKAPWLLVVFKKIYEFDNQNEKHNNYYVNESVGIAVGFLISAIHQAGLCTLTHTPSPMNFLEKILNRPSNERAYLLMPIGYAADETYVPDIHRKKLDEISQFFE
ncbi:MAG: nitroreductase family protein [Chitinophagaceae bacterium]